MSLPPKDEPSSFLPPRIEREGRASQRPSADAPKPLSNSIAPAPAEELRRPLPMWPLLVAYGVLIGIFLWLHPPRPLSATGRAAANLEPYVAQLPVQGARPAVATAPRICGKVAIVELDTKQVDPAFHELDPALVPKNASEIGTVAAVACREVSIGSYAGAKGSNTFLIRCRVDLVEYTSRAWLGGLTIDSEDLPAAMRRTGELHGARPDAALARWISSLPRACS